MVKRKMQVGDVVRITTANISTFHYDHAHLGMLCEVTEISTVADDMVMVDRVGFHISGKTRTLLLDRDEYEHIGDLAQLAYYAAKEQGDGGT